MYIKMQQSGTESLSHIKINTGPAFICWFLLLLWAVVLAGRATECKVVNYVLALIASPLYIIGHYMAYGFN